MTRRPIQLKAAATVPPLRTQTVADGSLYTRRPEIEQLIADLYEQPMDDVAKRAETFEQDHPDYLPPEVIVHFLRRSKEEGDTKPYRQLFSSLRQRLLHRLPQTDRKEAEVRQRVLDRVTEILCCDRGGYDVRFDYYEVNFNGAVARARKTAWRDVLLAEEKEQPEEIQSLETELGSESGGEVDAALRSLRGVSESFSDAIYRSEMLSAINSLPDDEKEVILMLVEGFKIKEIAEIVERDPKTVSARRDRARAKLREAMNLGENS